MDATVLIGAAAAIAVGDPSMGSVGWSTGAAALPRRGSSVLNKIGVVPSSDSPT